MSEEQAVLTVPETGNAGGETPSTTTEPSTQVNDQQPSVSANKVVVSSQTSSNQKHSKPSFFSSTREKLSQYEMRLREADQRVAKLEDLLSKHQINNAPAAPEQFVFQNDDDFYKRGIVESLKEFKKHMMDEIRKDNSERFGEYYGSYQESLKQQKLNEERQIAAQEVTERINKIRESGLDGKMTEILNKYPALNSGSEDPIRAKEILDFIESEYLKDINKTPLAPKKSRMGINGSGSPVGGSQGSPSLDQIIENRNKLMKEYPFKKDDPEFKKRWDESKMLYSQLIEKS